MNKKQLLGTAQITKLQIKIIKLRKKHSIRKTAAILNLAYNTVRSQYLIGMQRIRRLDYVKRIPAFILQGELLKREGKIPKADYSDLFLAPVKPSFKYKRRNCKSRYIPKDER